MKAVGIDKIGIGSAQFPADLVHLLDKPVVVMAGIHAHALSHRIGRFICRRKKGSVKSLLQGQLIAFLHADGRLIPFKKRNAVVGKGHRILQIAIFQRRQRGYQLVMLAG